MDIWYSWLAYGGLIAGLIVAAVRGVPAGRSAVIGFAGGIAVLIILNLVYPQPATCLQRSKGWDILRAYSLKCPNELETQILNR